jgi:hypothetical protein
MSFYDEREWPSLFQFRNAMSKRFYLFKQIGTLRDVRKIAVGRFRKLKIRKKATLHQSINDFCDLSVVLL